MHGPINLRSSSLYLHCKILPKHNASKFSLLLPVHVSSSVSFSVFFSLISGFLPLSFLVFLSVFSPKLFVFFFRIILSLFSLNFLLSSFLVVLLYFLYLFASCLCVFPYVSLYCISFCPCVHFFLSNLLFIAASDLTLILLVWKSSFRGFPMSRGPLLPQSLALYVAQLCT